MSEIGDEVQNLRDAGRFVDALQHMLTDGARRFAHRRHLLGMRVNGVETACLLLDGAAKQRDEFVAAVSEGPNLAELRACLPAALLESRLATLQAVSANQKPADIRTLLLDAVRYRSRDCPPALAPVNAISDEPWFLTKLRSQGWENHLRGVEADWREEVGEESGRPRDQSNWNDPALLHVCESVVYLLNNGQMSTEGFTVETWVLLEASVPQWGGKPNPEGLLARLVIEKIKGGAGLLYPDCRYAGYLPLDESFQAGLQNVMTTLRNHRVWKENGGNAFDYRWRLVPLRFDDQHQLPVFLDGLTGRSAEAAFACAIQAALLNERLDPRMAISACFAEAGASHERLGHVEGIIEKSLGLRLEATDADSNPTAGSEAKFHRIDKIVVCASENESSRYPDKVTVHDWSVNFIEAETFDAAYRTLSNYCQITDRVRSYLRDRSDKLLQATCDPYVRSSLSIRRKGDPQKKEPAEVPVELESDVVMNLLAGNVSREHYRTRVLAESGLGKSTMFIEAEHLIATDASNRVPLRLGAGPAACLHDDLGRWQRLPLLSDFHWDKDSKAVLPDLAEQLLGDVVSDEQVRSAWILEAVRRGDIVFLLDSLDQTDGQLKLDKFLKSDDVRDCVTLLSARPETRRTKSRGYAGIDWHTVWVDPFDEPRIRDYWADTPLLERVLETEEWKALREVPVLLHQLKRLAAVGLLQELPNREAVYYQTLEMMVQHGQDGMEDAGHDLAAQESLEGIQSLLAEISWQTIRLESESATDGTGSFTGELSDTAYSAFEREHKDLLTALDQLNLTTRQTYIDEFGKRKERFAWRHFSFCEWFAGLHLASLPPEEQRQIIAAHAIDERWAWILRFALCAAHRQKQFSVVRYLAECLLAAGTPFLLWKIIDPRGDGVDLPTIDEPLDTLCRWLVHRDSGTWDSSDKPETSPWDRREEFNGSRSMITTGDREMPSITAEHVMLLERMFLVKHRDSRWLHPAWELVIRNPDRCAEIRDNFLGEFDKQVHEAAERNCDRSEWLPGDRGLLQLVPDDVMVELSLRSQNELKAIRTWPDESIGDYEHRRDQFNQSLVESAANYCACPPTDWEYPYPDLPQNEQQLRLLLAESTAELQRCPVTNLQFEAFDTFHRRFRRTDWKREYESLEAALDDHPVIEVSWYQAVMLCIWLTGRGQFGHFDLPADDVWEACCRAGRDRDGDEFGIPWCDSQGTPIHDANGREQFGNLSSYGANFDGNYPHGEAEKGPYRNGTIPVGNFAANGFGLRDMHGQVWEWCSSPYDHTETVCDREEVPNAHTRVLRGGSWFIYARVTVASDRIRIRVGGRNFIIGFRLTRTR